jgi:uncharacterized protein
MTRTQNPAPRSAAVAIICKTPIPGSSKTRMIPLVGTDGAAELAGSFLRDVAAAIEAVDPASGRQGYAVYAPEGSEARLRTFLPADFGLLCRRDATLGVVLLGAAQHFLSAGHDCVVLVNADSPTLPSALIAAAIDALRQPGDRVVLGPAADGGYYLIGLKHAHERLFADIPWSTPEVYARTVARAGEIGVPVTSLATWYDVDEIDTLAMLLAEMHGVKPEFPGVFPTGGEAVFTRAFLAEHPELAEKVAAELARHGRA